MPMNKIRKLVYYINSGLMIELASFFTHSQEGMSGGAYRGEIPYITTKPQSVSTG